MAQFTLPRGLEGYNPDDVRALLGVSIEVSGQEQIRKNLQFLNQRLVEEATEEAHRLADYLLQESHKIVPYDTGDLYGSGKVDEDDEGPLRGFVVSYNTEYAWKVHEIPMNHPMGKGPYPGIPKQDHYLTTPAEQLASEFPDVMRSRLQKAVATAASQFALAPRVLSGPRLVKKPVM